MAMDRDWERKLKETSYDLPEATWQRLENDMRGWLAQQSRESIRSRSWLEPILAGFHHWGIRVAGGLAVCSLALGAWFWFSPSRANPDNFRWSQGQVLDAHGLAHWNWTAERCRIDGNDARMVLSEHRDGVVGIKLQRGEATFHVDHRKVNEVFAVEVGDCKVNVVGTVFTVGADSLRQWVSVEEGRIRLDHPKFHRFVDAGQKSACPAENSPAASVKAVPETIPAVEVASASREKPARLLDSLSVPSCTDGPACIRILSEFVRLHPNHPAAPFLALRWARLAGRSGDMRDALVAYGIASASGTLSDVSRLESLRLRYEHLSQEKAVADSLDGWIPTLRPGSSIWHQAWTLRGEVARRMGDSESVARAQKALNAPVTAESGK